MIEAQQAVGRVHHSPFYPMDSGVASSIAQHLKQQQSQIIRAWIDSVRDDPHIKSSRSISEPELADHLPRLFDDLINYLQNSGDEDSTKIVTLEARKHGNQRWRQGYQLTELLREIANIRRLIMIDGLSPLFRLQPECSAHQDEGRDLIDQFFGNVIAGSVDEYVENFALRLNESARFLAEANDRLREIDRSRLFLIRGIAHDLGNFVNALNWAVEGLDSTIDEASRIRLLDVLRRNLEDTGSLVRQLSDYSILLSGELHLEIEEIFLPLFSKEILDTFGPIAEASGLTLQVTHQPDLQSIRSDRPKLKQIISNLISNAIKFRKRDNPSGLIELVFKSHDEDHWQLSVSDSGVGIPAKDLETIFKEFYRSAATGDVPGSGLGLTITQKLVLLMAGTITVSSEVGLGTHFVLTFPIGAKKQ